MTNTRMPSDLAALVAATQAVKEYTTYRRVRLPWWKMILKWRRYELRPVSLMQSLVDHPADFLARHATKWNEVEIVRLTDDR